MSTVNCPKCGRTAKIATQPILGVRIFRCDVCKKVHAEGDRWWVEQTPGWEETLLDRCERVASDKKRMDEFMDAGLDSPWFDSTELNQ
jgi:endogenous inhibitor of DNA gyrase (YacG/DUF329 family)